MAAAAERVAARIRRTSAWACKIASGELKPGDKLPSVAQLRAHYNASSTAVRNAMLVLREAGLVQGHQGKGVYVRTPES